MFSELWARLFPNGTRAENDANFVSGRYQNGRLIQLLDADGTGSSLNGVVYVASSRTLTADDDGKVLDCAASVIVTIPANWGQLGCAVRPAGTQVACASGVTTNGSNTTKTLTAQVGAISPTNTASNYDLVGAST